MHSNNSLPGGGGELFEGNQTPYFEPLELLDFYISEFSMNVNSGKGE